MDDSMIGRWLSDLPMDDPSKKSWSKPQLRRFVHADKPIEFLELLGEGGEGIVYKVRIEGRVYALKIFNEWVYVGISIDEKLKPYTSPFANECRAFARLDSIGENGTWAVKCHGWMKLSDEQVHPVRRYLLHGGHTAATRWAIVKDYLPDPVQISDTPEIRRKMKIAQTAVIHPMDIHPRNYRGSFLVDLGSVRTFPYVRRLWSDRAFGNVFEMHEKGIGAWEIDEADGKMALGGTNAGRKRLKEEEAEMRRRAEEKANSRSLPSLGYDNGSVEEYIPAPSG